MRAGQLEVEPELTFGSMAAPAPGCAAYLPTLPPNEVPEHGLAARAWMDVGGTWGEDR